MSSPFLKLFLLTISHFHCNYTFVELIAEVVLYSEGFASSSSLAQKITILYKLCTEQLSPQDHYDFGLRAIKSVLTAAGSMKRKTPDEDEQIIIIRALFNSNLPKFLSGDAVLFQVSSLNIYDFDIKFMANEFRGEIFPDVISLFFH